MFLLLVTVTVISMLSVSVLQAAVGLFGLSQVISFGTRVQVMWLKSTPLVIIPVLTDIIVMTFWGTF